MDTTEQNYRGEADLIEQAIAKKMVRFLNSRLKDPDGRVRSEELISATAAIVGERCFEAAVDFDPRHHKFAPGTHILSARVNELLSGDVLSDGLNEIPSTSIIGALRDQLVGHGYEKADFPAISTVFVTFVTKIGDPSDWGRVPLSVPEDYLPALLPLQVEYETRLSVDQIFSPLQRDRMRCLRAATLALAEVLRSVSQSIDHNIAILLALETANGTAKTAPMTDEALS